MTAAKAIPLLPIGSRKYSRPTQPYTTLARFAVLLYYLQHAALSKAVWNDYIEAA